MPSGPRFPAIRPAARPRTERQGACVFHASSTAPVPKQTGGAVGEGWETQLRRRLKRAMVPPADLQPSSQPPRACRIERAMVPPPHRYHRRNYRRACRIGRGEVSPQPPTVHQRRHQRAARIETGDVPQRTWQAGPRAPSVVPDDPAPRFPPPAHRRCACLGGSRPWTARGKRAQLGPARVARASRERSASAAFRPLLQLGAFSTLRPRRGPREKRAAAGQGWERDSVLEWGDVRSGTVLLAIVASAKMLVCGASRGRTLDP